MVDIRVWAPEAGLVELVSAGRTVAMTRNHGGWWTAAAPFVEHGVDYAFRVDGEVPLPDPRSPWQPQGVHGASRWVDHHRFEWTDAGWQQVPVSAAVIYELHVGTFTPEGTFDAVIDRLDHLVDLGVTHVELMPVVEFSGTRGWGYDGVDLYAPHHVYGGPGGLKRLVDACHRRGLAVLLDVVYNHLGPVGCYHARFGPYLTQRYATPWGQAVNLDGPGSDEVRRFFLDNALMWLRDYHVDGLRLDAVHAIVDTSAIHFLEQLAGEVEHLEAELGRHVLLIAESDLNDPRVIRSRDAGGYGVDAQWNDDFHHALHALLTGERQRYYQDFGTLADLARALTRGFVYDNRYSTYRRRRHGRPAAGISGGQLVGYLQSHDQVGNRALGERASHLLSPGQLAIAAALVMTSPFVPMLFQGEEWGSGTRFLYFTDHRDPEVGERVARGRRSEFAAMGWDPDDIADPQAEDTFRRSQLDWDEPSRPQHGELLQWYRSLISLRRGSPDLVAGSLAAIEVRFDEAARWLIMTRGSMLVAVNFADASQRISLPTPAGELVLCSDEAIAVGDRAIALPGRAVAILRRA